MKRNIITIIVTLGTILSYQLNAQSIAGQKMIKNNSLGEGADPWVIKDGAYYYMCMVTAVNKSFEITISKSKKLSAQANIKTVWKSPEKGWNSNYVWAPELHKVGKRWYIYYAAGKSGPPFIHQRSGVLESVSEDPQGKYIDRGLLNTGIDQTDPSGYIWSIDLTIATINHQLYAIWSGWQKNVTSDHTQQNLYIAKMKNPWTIGGDRVQLSAPDQPWEKGAEFSINEGPQVLQRNGKVFIVYSTRESWTPAYRLGQLKLKNVNQSPLNSKNWEKSGPVFQGNDVVHGVGHASFVQSPDLTEWWIIYHTKKTTKPGWEREMCIKPFIWNKNGSPNFGTALPIGTLIKAPSGE